MSIINQKDIAIIAMDCSVPGAPNLNAYWDMLLQGKEGLRDLTDDEKKQLPQAKNYITRGGYLEDISLFDATRFGFTPREAQLLDPQHRLFLQSALRLLNSTPIAKTQQNIGVFASQSFSGYLHELMQHTDISEKQSLLLSNVHDCLATRVAYCLNLTGPAFTIQCGCSSSLVAVHQARLALLAKQCDVAIAGGITIVVPHNLGYWHTEGGFASPDGHCRPFSSDAQGTVFASGFGTVLLKRLSDAIADNDFIYAVIKGSAINNDGSNKMTFTSPSVTGQAQVIAKALRVANITSDQMDYVEAHGTATPIGDPIELAALEKAFNESSAHWKCHIGSVKANVGHLDVAAGVVGFIKTALMLFHKKNLPQIHFKDWNTKILNAEQHFEISKTVTAFKKEVVRAGVSAFGFGGSNAHVILESFSNHSIKAPTQPEDSKLNLQSFWYEEKSHSKSTFKKLDNEFNRWVYEKTWQEIKFKPNANLEDGAPYLIIAEENRDAYEKLFSTFGVEFNCTDTCSAINKVKYKSCIFIPKNASLVEACQSSFELFSQLVNNAELITHLTKFITVMVDGQQLFNTSQPANNLWLGLTRSIGQEFPHIQTHIFDLEHSAATDLINLLCMNQNDLVLVRDKKYWIESYTQHSKSQNITYFKHNGRYLITGGLGDVASVYINYLSKDFNAELILIGRSSAVQKQNQIDHLSKQYNIQYFQADITDIESMQAVLTQCQPIDGIIHIAGVSSDMHYKLLSDLSWQHCLKLFAPKLQGLNVIKQLTDQYHIQQCVIISSISSALAGVGLGAYATCHNLTDAWVQKHKPHWLLMNWDAWNFHPDNMNSQLGAGISALAINPNEGLEVLRLAFTSPAWQQFYISTGFLNERAKAWLTRKPVEKIKTQFSARPSLMVEYCKPQTELHQKLIDLWQHILGIAPIGIQDNFFELGGHSLLALELIANMQKQMNVLISITDFFAAATVEKLSLLLAPTKKINTSSIQQRIQKQKAALLNLKGSL